LPGLAGRTNNRWVRAVEVLREYKVNTDNQLDKGTRSPLQHWARLDKFYETLGKAYGVDIPDDIPKEFMLQFCKASQAGEFGIQWQFSVFLMDIGVGANVGIGRCWQDPNANACEAELYKHWTIA
jgi:hypothetical protein